MRTWLFIVLAVSLAAWPARADEPVILLVTHEQGPFVRRLRAELESMGFRVVTQPKDEPVPEGTVAVSRLAAGPPHKLDIETVGEVQRQSVVFDGEDATEVGSVRMAERVRAAFQPLAPRRVEEIPPASSASESSAPPTPPKPALTRPRAALPVVPTAPVPERRVWMGVSLAPALFADSRHLGMHALASYYVSPMARFRFEPFLLAPLVPTAREGDEGKARLYAGLIGALLNGVAFESHRFELVLGGGVSAVWLRVDGDPAPGYSVRADNQFAASFLADAAFRIRVYEGFFLTPRAFVGVTAPTIEVELAERSVDGWGLPWLSVALAAEFDWAP